MLRIIAMISQLQRAGKGHANLQTASRCSRQRTCPTYFSPKASLVLTIKGRSLMKPLTPGGQGRLATAGLVFP